MEITLNYTKLICLFALYQTPPHLDLACPQAREDQSIEKHTKFSSLLRQKQCSYPFKSS